MLSAKQGHARFFTFHWRKIPDDDKEEGAMTTMLLFIVSMATVPVMLGSFAYMLMKQ